ncbi:MAG: hypothetical protein A2068_05825 [Ignavibacteria bacterium GWB2_35_6b]|nr:MAG: hypothetical protein A2068_05825 [Ignavibacteria bacterium GWB2_35_6b]
MKNPKNTAIILLLAAFLFLVSSTFYAENINYFLNESDSVLAKQAVTNFQTGIINNNAELLKNSVWEDFIMFNGNYSGDPVNWQAHMYLAENNFGEWTEWFLKEAGPHNNNFEFLHLYIRGNSAIVVTKDTGNNKFRNWKDEVVTWILGKRNSEWKLLGFFIKDIKNPG